MIKKILVTTDLSGNSKAGIRFALQLAKQASSFIIFYSTLELNKPTRWSESKYDNYVGGEISKTKEKLENFIKNIYKDERIRPGKYQCVVEGAATVQEGIIEYAAEKKVDFICMSTRGAGKLSRILGTNTSSIIKHSPIPVLAIPKNYRTTSIKHILYASDFDSLQGELKKVKRFADSVNSKVTVLHYDYLYQIEEVRKKFEKVASRQNNPGVNFHLENFDIENSLSYHLKNAVKRFDPSLVVLFTNQKRDWFDRLFLSSTSAEVSFDSKKPLLIYSKKT
jgi:nucleotide-binding universal stress UspA family protein